MILFAGIPSEPPLALAIESAEREGKGYALFNQRRAAFCDLHLEWRDDAPHGEIWLEGKRYDLAEFSGIYARTVEASTLPENRPRRTTVPDPFEIARSEFMLEVLHDWLEIAPCAVINRPRAMASNISKPYQTQLILGHGFSIPPTLVTNDPEAVVQFRAQHGRIVYKSVSSVRSIVTEWDGNRAGLHKLCLLPTQFQAYIPGTNVRVHVVGDSVFASEIESEAVDYRYARREDVDARMSAAVLPPDVEDKCVEMTRAMGLAFSGIDLKRTPDGEWFCFEVNTSPGYSYFQQHTDQHIADALVRYLS